MRYKKVITSLLTGSALLIALGVGIMLTPTGNEHHELSQVVSEQIYDDTNSSSRYAHHVNTIYNRYSFRRHGNPLRTAHMMIEAHDMHKPVMDRATHMVYPLSARQKMNATDKVSRLDEQDDEFDTAVRADLVHDVNEARIQHGVRPLAVTNLAQATADYRDPRVQYAYNNLSDYRLYMLSADNPTDNWVHGVDTDDTGGQYMDCYVRYPMKWGANAGEWHLGLTRTARAVARKINDSYLYHDMTLGNNNGHRDNELNPQWRYLGIGVTYDGHTHKGSNNMQFACKSDEPYRN